jgi:hypothetical protein
VKGLKQGSRCPLCVKDKTVVEYVLDNAPEGANFGVNEGFQFLVISVKIGREWNGFYSVPRPGSQLKGTFELAKIEPRKIGRIDHGFIIVGTIQRKGGNQNLNKSGGIDTDLVESKVVSDYNTTKIGIGAICYKD